MAELADALDSKSSSRKGVRVRPPLRVPEKVYAMEKPILELRQNLQVFLTIFFISVSVFLAFCWIEAWKTTSQDVREGTLTSLELNFVIVLGGCMVLASLWYPFSRLLGLNNIGLGPYGVIGGFPPKFLKWEEINDVSRDDRFLTWSFKYNVHDVTKFNHAQGCRIVGSRIDVTVQELHDLMKLLIAESSFVKRIETLLFFKKVKTEADKNKIIRIDSLDEDEQDELRDLLTQREEMWKSSLRECSFDNGPDVDWFGCESQKIDDELRRRGWMV